MNQGKKLVRRIISLVTSIVILLVSLNIDTLQVKSASYDDYCIFLDEGEWKVSGEDTVYNGGIKFYVAEDEQLEFIRN